MTTDRAKTVIDQAVVESRDQPGRRLIVGSLLVLLVGLVVLAFGVLRGMEKIDTLQVRADDNARSAQLLATQVEKLGGVPVVRPPDPQQGPRGEQGPAGRGIAGTSIVDGRLLIAYSDGTTEDKGRVVGQPGHDGDAGRGVAGTGLVDGHLILNYSDGTTEDAGQVVGPAGKQGDKGEPGRGIASTAITNGRLIITYTDGTTQDLGPVVGRGVQRAYVENCRWFVVYTPTGETEDAGNACTTQTVTSSPTTTTPPALLPTQR
jgi:hypothetical protein